MVQALIPGLFRALGDNSELARQHAHGDRVESEGYRVRGVDGVVQVTVA
jgi:hypothetical protein